MANIKVDHSKFDTTASAIDTFTSTLNSKMNKANSTMTGLFSSWNGKDASAYKTKWDALDGSDSTYYKMKKSMEGYSKFLRTAGNKYKQAQIDAVNRANKLHTW